MTDIDKSWETGRVLQYLSSSSSQHHVEVIQVEPLNMGETPGTKTHLMHMKIPMEPKETQTSLFCLKIIWNRFFHSVPSCLWHHFRPYLMAVQILKQNEAFFSKRGPNPEESWAQHLAFKVAHWRVCWWIRSFGPTWDSPEDVFSKFGRLSRKWDPWDWRHVEPSR